jgi:hypothetical protein
MSQLENIVVDYETFWDADYTLKKMSTTEYVRDALFQTLGVSLLRESEQYRPRFLRYNQIIPYYNTIDWSSVRFIAHNLHFDGLIHAEHYGIVPGEYFCTMSAARYVHRGKVRHSVEALAKYYKLKGKLDGLAATKGKRAEELTEAEWQLLEPYAIHDGKLELFYYFDLAPQIPATELIIMDETFRMFCDPILEVDLNVAREALADAERTRSDKIGAGGVDIKVLRSRNKFANYLREIGIEPPLKISKTTRKQTFAFARTDEAFTELLEHPEEEVRTLVEAKLESSSNLPITRAQRLIKLGETGKCAVALHPWGAKTTLRDSAGNKMNMQNFVRGSKLRRAIKAPDDHVIIVADQSQIEVRKNAWFCGQEDLLQTFRDKRDPYNEMATKIYGRPINRKLKVVGPDGVEFKPDEKEGFVGKTSVLSLGYQASAPRLKHALATNKEMKVVLPLDECYHVVNTYRSTCWCIAGMWEQGREWLDFMAYGTGTIDYKCITIDADTHKVWGPDGTFLYYPGLSKDGGQFTYIDNGGADSVYIYGGKFLENLIQWLSRAIIMYNVRQIKAKYGYKLAGRVHDELQYVVHKSIADAAMQNILKEMRSPPPWALDIPLDAEAAYDTCYSK